MKNVVPMFFRMILRAALGVLTFAFAPIADAGDTVTTTPANYARPFEPSTRPAFIPLPPGAVEPVGWLRDWCVAARDGYTGHMDEYDAEFKRAWAPDHTMTGERRFWFTHLWMATCDNGVAGHPGDRGMKALANAIVQAVLSKAKG